MHSDRAAVINSPAVLHRPGAHVLEESVKTIFPILDALFDELLVTEVCRPSSMASKSSLMAIPFLSGWLSGPIDVAKHIR